jgi:3'(2'), 5'-bisphosphate nucleotidase
MRLVLIKELDAAAVLARRAGATITSLYGRQRARTKVGGSPVTTADRAANRIIVRGLREQFPADAVLSEETRDDAARLEHRRVWIVDPLDGTREYMMGISEFCVMIGLAIDGEAVLGVVYNPAADTLYGGVVGGAAFMEQGAVRLPLRVQEPHGRKVRLVGSRSHSDARLLRIQRELDIGDVRVAGSVGIKCTLIARGECDLYVHPVPYLSEWDTCAPEAVLRAAGGEVTDCLGDRLRYNKPVPRQPFGIVATTPSLLERVLPVVRDAFNDGPTVAGATP